MSTAGRCTSTWSTTSRSSATPIRGSPNRGAASCGRLNTNSRFNYEAVVEFSERLAATAARPAGHRVPGELRFGGKRFGAAAGHGGHRPRDVVAVREAYHGWTYATDAVSTSIGRQPERARHPSGLGAYGGVAEQLSRQVPRRRRRPVRGRRGRADRGRWSRTAARPRRSSASRCTATPAGWRCRTATWSRCTRRCARAAAWPSPTRSRSGTAGSATGSGVSSSRASCPTSCRWRSPPATATPLGAVITSRAIAEAFAQSGLLLLVDRRQPAVVRDRAHRARRTARRGPAGERRASRRTI